MSVVTSEKDLNVHTLLYVILVIPHNQPIFSGNVSWNSDAITILNASQLSNNPTHIFVSKNNTWYIIADAFNPILSGSGSNVSPATLVSGGHCLFVPGNGDIYACDDNEHQITRWSMNGTTSQPVTFVSTYCGGLFLSVNHTLYCSLNRMNQVITKSLDEPTNKQTVVAGTGCFGSSSMDIVYPAGIFVDLN